MQLVIRHGAVELIRMVVWGDVWSMENISSILIYVAVKSPAA